MPIGSLSKIKNSIDQNPDDLIDTTGTKEPTTDASALLDKPLVIEATAEHKKTAKGQLKRKSEEVVGYIRKKKKTQPLAKDVSTQEPKSQRDLATATHPVTQEPSSQREDADTEAAQIIVNIAQSDLLADSVQLLQEKQTRQEILS